MNVKELTLSEMVTQSHGTAMEKGWHDRPRSFGDLIALIHSELSEALEAFRDPKYSPCEVWWVHDESGQPLKPEGVPIELADVLIRIGDLCGEYGIDLGVAVNEKLIYNKSRPYRHGGKRV